MIAPDKRLVDLTWGEIVSDLDTRYGKNPGIPTLHGDGFLNEFMNVRECAALTGYTPGYIRQLVFKRMIPFHKNPTLKPVRFKRSEILAWMATNKYIPRDELAEQHIADHSVLKKQSKKDIVKRKASTEKFL